MRVFPAYLAAGLIVAATAAFAGAPLKGVDVKLGRNPGGFVNARMGADGAFSFPVQPAGTYELELVSTDGATPPKAVLVVKGGAKAINQTLSFATARRTGDVLTTIEMVSDGKTPITGTLQTADTPGTAATN